jgi:hypothetical protein
MSYIAQNLEHHSTRGAVGSGQCVALVQAWAGAPTTSTWRQGIKVKGNGSTISKGTVIATMVDGHYPNHAHGNHAAIFLSEDSNGIRVMDQWTGHAPSIRTIHFHGGTGSPSNDADKFYVVE